MEMEVEFHDEREFERWLRRAGGITTGRIAGKLALVAMHGGARVGMPTVRMLGGGLYEIRVGVWRVYFMQRGTRLIVLCGGTKDSQPRDITRTRRRMP
jgi:putative addiction module killer protein